MCRQESLGNATRRVPAPLTWNRVQRTGTEQEQMNSRQSKWKVQRECVDRCRESLSNNQNWTTERREGERENTTSLFGAASAIVERGFQGLTGHRTKCLTRSLKGAGVSNSNYLLSTLTIPCLLLRDFKHFARVLIMWTLTIRH